MLILILPQRSLERRTSLIRTINSCLSIQILQTLLPRAAMIGFNFSQAFLINDAIAYLEKPVSQRDQNRAYGLIGVTAIIYCGKTVS
jgi:hypothetical protein